MASGVTTIKAIFVPFLVSLVIFLTITFALLPAWRRYRARYSQYLPLDAISDGTSSLRDRLRGRFGRLSLTSRFSLGGGNGGTVFTTDHGGRPDSPASQEGEELDDVDEQMLRAMEGRTQHGARPDNSRRLSRDLEEGFRDDSSDDSSDSD